jgi:alkylated DNA repair dioxygenase AlkB
MAPTPSAVLKNQLQAANQQIEKLEVNEALLHQRLEFMAHLWHHFRQHNQLRNRCEDEECIQNSRALYGKDGKPDILYDTDRPQGYKILEANKKLVETLTLIANMPEQSMLDEYIPDDDKVKAYEMGYANCLIDVKAKINQAQEVTNERN